jgi:glycosyltransferase involved in cell wall biosynthesis
MRREWSVLARYRISSRRRSSAAVVQLRGRVTVGIVSNGFADGPAQALRDYLVAKGVRVVTVFHPLTPEQGTQHSITVYADGAQVRERNVRLPLKPPASFALDPFVPLLPEPVDAWFGFNPLACARGLVARRQRRARRVVLWSVDFVPDRFGAGTVATRIYDRIDRLCCTRADARVELSEAARQGRNRRHELPCESAHAYIVPMGAWIGRVPTTTQEGFRQRRVVFLGHLVARQGVGTLLAALSRLGDVAADVIGTGPLEAELRERAKHDGLDVTFHGYVVDHREVERLLSRSSVAVAPYAQTDETFTRYADPGKLKAYLAAGLPIVMTDVPPNGRELASMAGADVVADDPTALADAISRALQSSEHWRARRKSALAYARRFDWDALLGDLLAELDLNPSAKPAR